MAKVETFSEKLSEIRKGKAFANVATDYGKLPPQAIEIENNILGVLLLIPDSYHNISDFLTPQMFYRDENKIIYQSIIDIHKQQLKVDILTITENLRKNDTLEKVGGAYYVMDLTSRVGSSESLEQWSRIIAEKWMYRKLIEITQQASIEGYNSKTDPFDLVKITIDNLTSIIEQLKTGFHNLSDYYEDLITIILNNQQGQLSGILTPFKEFNDKSGGLHPGNMIVLAGETSQGKTAAALNIADCAAEAGNNVLILSYEMTGEETAARFLAMKTGINSRRILYSALEHNEVNIINKATKAESNIYFDECHSASLFHLEKTVNNAVINKNCKLIVIDYIQKITTGDKKVEEMAKVSGAIKQMAKKLKVPIIAISQLSRDPDPKPSLRRLRWAGEIEQDADVVWFIWRPESYGLMNFECNNQETLSAGRAHHIIAKGRNIGTFEFITGWDPNSLRFPDDEGNSLDNFVKDKTDYFSK